MSPKRGGMPVHAKWMKHGNCHSPEVKTHEDICTLKCLPLTTMTSQEHDFHCIPVFQMPCKEPSVGSSQQTQKRKVFSALGEISWCQVNGQHITLHNSNYNGISD